MACTIISVDSATSHVSAMDSFTLESSLKLATGDVQIVRYAWECPTRDVWTTDAYFLHMCLSARPAPAQATYLGEDRQITESLGRVMFVPPGREVRSSGGSGAQRSLVCSINPQLFERVLGRQPIWNHTSLAQGLHLNSPEVEWYLLKMYDEILIPGFAREIMVESLFNGLVVALVRSLRLYQEEPQSRNGGLTSWQMQLIRDRVHSAEPMPQLTELANLCGISVRHLTRTFKAESDLTVAKFIEHAMIERAHLLLSDQEISIEEIAARLGFSSPSSFTCAFRRATGSRPAEFRRRLPIH